MGFFSKLRKGLEKTKHSLIQNIETVVRGYAKIDDDMYDDLEAVMLTGDIGVETTEYLLDQIRTGVKSKEIKDGNDVVPYLEKCIVALLNENDEPLPETDGPRVIFIVGVNGVGKTTTIGKLAKYYKQQGKSVMLAAGDTFRAAASEQLTIWRTASAYPSSSIRKAPMQPPSSSMPRRRPKPRAWISSSSTRPAACRPSPTSWKNCGKWPVSLAATSKELRRKRSSSSMPRRARMPSARPNSSATSFP